MRWRWKAHNKLRIRRGATRGLPLRSEPGMVTGGYKTLPYAGIVMNREPSTEACCCNPNER